MIACYMRISTNKESQKIDRQKITLESYAKENNFEFDLMVEERVSGKIKAKERKQYSTLKDKLKSGDTLVITDIDRLGRNADDTIIELKDLKAKGIRVVALDVPYMNEWDKVNDDSIYDMIRDIVITLKAHMAQQEREKISTRVKQGLAAAREEGRVGGRPQVGSDKFKYPKNFIKYYEQWKNKDIKKVEFARLLNVSRPTLDLYIKTYEANIK